MRKILFFLVLGPVLASCGGASIGRQGNIKQGGLQTLLPAFNTLMTGLRPGGSPTLPTRGMPSGISTSAIRTLAVPTCVTEAPTPVTDADSDGIALLKEYTYDCQNEVSSTDTYKYKGTTKIEDLDDSKKWSRGGYKITFNSNSEYSRSTGGSGKFGYAGYWSSTASGASTVYKGDYTAAVIQEDPTYPKQDFSIRGVWNMTITGADENSPWLAGKYSGGGLYELSGTFMYEEAGKHETKTNANVTLEFKALDLEYDSTCTDFYKSGAWVFLDGSGNEYKVVYECTSNKKYLNGVLQ